MNNNEMTMLYSTLLCTPGMNENVKLNLQVNRKLVLLLSQLLETGLSQPKDQGSVLTYFPNEAGDELKMLMADILEKSGLSDLHDRLKGFNPK